MNKAGFIRSLPTISSMKNKPSPSKQMTSTVSDLTAESSIVNNIHTSYDLLIQTMVVDDQTTEILQNEMNDDDPIIAMKAQSDPYTMYHHQAMKQSDHQLFAEAMDKEIRDQMANGNFILLPKSSLPKGATVLNAVWQMKWKRDIRTGKITKYKARLNIDGSRMVKGRDYDLTYAPVATWNAIRLVLSMILLNK